MGTRSLTHVFNEQEKEVLCIYRQMDGYPSGHGRELAEFLGPFTIVNGITSGQPEPKANGMGCLAAQLVAHLKQGVGEFYIYPPGSTDCWEEWVYTITPDGHGGLVLTVSDTKNERFSGPPGQLTKAVAAAVEATPDA